MKQPSSLYKYVTTDRTDIFTEGVVRFTQPQAFNDPFEALPSLRTLLTDAEIEKEFNAISDEIVKGSKFAQVLYDEQVPAELRKTIPFERFTEFLDTQRRSIVGKAIARKAEFLDRINRGEFFPPGFPQPPFLGILSLAEKPDNLLMWAHYAKNHEGFVIEFDMTAPFFSKGHLAKVIYSRKRPSFHSADFSDKLELLKKIHVTKSECWKYEREWRFFLPLGENQKVIDGENAYSIYLFALPPSAIKSLVLGYRMADSMKTEIRKILEAKAEFSHIKILGTRLDDKTFGLKITS